VERACPLPAADCIPGRQRSGKRRVRRERDGGSERRIEPSNPFNKGFHQVSRGQGALADSLAGFGHGQEVEISEFTHPAGVVGLALGSGRPMSGG